jgi:hypothetical protein
LDDGELDSLSERPVYIAFEYVEDGSTVEYLYCIEFEEGGEGGAGPCESVEAAVSEVKQSIRSFEDRYEVSRIGPGHIDLEDETESVDVEDVVPSQNLGDFL